MSTSLEARPDTAPEAPAPRTPPPMPRRLVVRRVLRYTLLILLALLFVSPLIFMLVTSFKTRGDAASLPPTWFPNPFSTDAYGSLLATTGQTPVLRWFGN